jgi:hypothetical protein
MKFKGRHTNYYDWLRSAFIITNHNNLRNILCEEKNENKSVTEAEV